MLDKLSTVEMDPMMHPEDMDGDGVPEDEKESTYSLQSHLWAISDSITEDDLIDIMFSILTPNNLQTQAGKDVKCIDKVLFFPTIEYKMFCSEVIFIMTVRQSLVSVGYKFSTAQNNDPASSIKHTKALKKLFQDAIPMAIATEKPGHKPFKVWLFKIKAKTSKEAEPVCVKEKQVVSIFIW